MKKKQNSLRQKIEQAEKRERYCRRRMESMNKELRRANAISDGSQIWINILANRIGAEFHISVEEIEQSKEKVYMVRKNGDNTYDFRQQQ